MTESQPILDVQHVAREFPGPRGGRPLTVLRDVTLQLDRGQSMAIVGPSGCGKSTLLNIVGALDAPTSGSVRLAGRALAGLPDDELASIRNREVGFVFQFHHLLPQCSVMENVLLPALPGRSAIARAEAQERARRLLERVRLADRAGQRPATLSGGECQRVAVVRALINEPPLLLADEPTGSLDRRAAADLGSLLLGLCRDARLALLLVTHSEALARQMDRTRELVDGALV